MENYSVANIPKDNFLPPPVTEPPMSRWDMGQCYQETDWLSILSSMLSIMIPSNWTLVQQEKSNWALNPLWTLVNPYQSSWSTSLN